ncbi:cytochrome P450 reductase [Oratosquilla oratoria]|uniref:cytochrome P450 reductase n=1 Tax=Oratosquilla oratoria TaxID=337810 RepID=UPI003F77178F
MTVLTLKILSSYRSCCSECTPTASRIHSCLLGGVRRRVTARAGDTRRVFVTTKTMEVESIIDNTAGEAVEDGEEPLIGMLDIVLLLLLAGVSVYYFWFKDQNKQDEAAILKTFTISPTQIPARTSDTGFLGKLKSSGKNVIVFYGSQTGTAEEFAVRLAKEASRYGMKGMIADPEESDMSELAQLCEINNHLAIFCMATYGEGDPTDNSQEFYEFLQSGDVDLDGLNYTVFGLGNKTYEHYNAMGKYVDKRLEELGATRLYELGLGDDDANMEDDFITWKDSMWPRVCEEFGLEGEAEDINMRQYRLIVHDDIDPERIYTGEVARLHSFKNQRPPFDAKNPKMAQVSVNKELHKNGSNRNCMHIELDIEGSRVRYDAGDHVAVYPVNNSNLVTRIGELLEVDLDTIVTLTNVDEDSTKKQPFPCPCSYRTALLHYVDVMALPRTHVLKELAEYTTDNKEKEKLLLMSSTTEEGKAEYHKWIVDDVRSIVHILEDLPSCKPSLDHLCELLPRLQARYYSISSSSKVYPSSIHITAVVVKYETPTGRTNHGVATTWLHNMKPNNDKSYRVPIFVRKSQFRLPNKPQTPVIMIGPGTGIAPFRGFLQERNYMKEQGKDVGETVLYFGCRYKAEDFLYEDELQNLVDSGLLTLHTAFSRDQPEKIYVTHLLENNKADVWRIIGKEKGHFYVCGDAKSMARDVHSIIIKICQTEGGMSDSEAETYVKKMVTQKRYSSDVWS